MESEKKTVAGLDKLKIISQYLSSKDFIEFMHYYPGIKRSFGLFDPLKFKQEAFAYFSEAETLVDNERWEAHDRFFNIFSTPWLSFLQSRFWVLAEQVFEFSLELAYEWEKTNSKDVHKGTPYYFRSLTDIVRGDLERGLLLMHQAHREDIKHRGTSARGPAYACVTLDTTVKENFFRDYLIETEKWLEELLERYRQTHVKTLTLAKLRQVLQNYPKDEVSFFFAYAIFKLKREIEINKAYRSNSFASLLELNVFLTLCRLVEDLIYEKTGAGRLKGALENLSKNSGLSLHKDDKLRKVEVAFYKNQQGILRELLEGKYIFEDSTKPTQIEIDLTITFITRNFSTHRIEMEALIYEQFDELAQRIINSVFFTIEELYP